MKEKRQIYLNRLIITKFIYLLIITVFGILLIINILSIETTKDRKVYILNTLALERKIEENINNNYTLDLIQSKLRQNIKKSPLDIRSIHLLSKIEYYKGNKAHSDKLMNLAFSRAKRDPIVNAWLINRSITQEKLKEAFFHLDLLLRVARTNRERLLTNALYLLEKPEARKALADLLREMTPWRNTFFYILNKQAYNLQSTFDFMNLLIDGKGLLMEREINPYLEALINHGNLIAAHNLWSLWLPDNMRLLLTWPYNRNFEQTPSGGPFDWKFIGKNVDIKLIQRKDRQKYGDDLSLRVGFFKQQASSKLMTQTLVLPPGLYSLRGSIFTENFRSKRGVIWRVYCLDNNKVAISTGNALYSSTVWQEFSFSFDIPQSGCAGQILSLELILRVPSDSRIQGNLWFDDLVIAPLVGQTVDSAVKGGE